MGVHICVVAMGVGAVMCAPTWPIMLAGAVLAMLGCAAIARGDV